AKQRGLEAPGLRRGAHHSRCAGVVKSKQGARIERADLERAPIFDRVLDQQIAGEELAPSDVRAPARADAYGALDARGHEVTPRLPGSLGAAGQRERSF